jgi:hypothetical protein
MSFRLWSSKSQSTHPPPLVALDLPSNLSRLLEQAALAARIPFATVAPPKGDYILALTPTQERPPQTAPHIPIVDAGATDLLRQIEEALLYLEAHHRLKQ